MDTSFLILLGSAHYLFIYLFIYLYLLIWLCSRHAEIPGPGIKPVPQQQPEPLQ